MTIEDKVELLKFLVTFSVVINGLLFILNIQNQRIINLMQKHIDALKERKYYKERKCIR